METYYSAQTPLIWQSDLPQDNLWPQQTNYNYNNTINTNTDFTNYYSTVSHSPNEAGLDCIGFDCLELDLDLETNLIAFQLDPQTEEDSLKSVLSDIESISSGFMPGELSPSSSSDTNSVSLLDQEIVSESSGDEVTSECRGIRRAQSGRVNKRESNKIAAVRYRAKKVKEREALFKECDEMAARNAQLRTSISEIEQEIGFIKNLLVQALHAKRN